MLLMLILQRILKSYYIKDFDIETMFHVKHLLKLPLFIIIKCKINK